MGKTKYMPSNGLAFSEQKDMEKLAKKAKQGWMLKKFAFMGYRLEKSEPEDIQYSIDYRSLEKGEKEEYFELFQMAGWSHVCSNYDIHIFKAATGTQPIYSDPDSTVDKVSRLAKPIYSIAGFLVLFFIFSLFLKSVSIGIISQIGQCFHFISIVLLVPTIMMLISIHYRKWKVVSSRKSSI